MAFTPVRTSTLRGDQKSALTFFVEVAGKHIFTSGAATTSRAIASRAQGEKSQEAAHPHRGRTRLPQYLSDNIDAAYDAKSNRPMETRGQIIQGLQQAASETVMENPDDPNAYAEAKDGSQRFVHFIMNQDRAIQSLMAVENLDQNLSHHCVTVRPLPVEIGKRTGQHGLQEPSRSSSSAACFTTLATPYRVSIFHGPSTS